MSRKNLDASVTRIFPFAYRPWYSAFEGVGRVYAVIPSGLRGELAAARQSGSPPDGLPAFMQWTAMQCICSTKQRT